MAGGSIPPVGTTMTTPASNDDATNHGRAVRGLDQRVLARLRRLALDVDALIVVGFSGGVDSLSLAATLARLRRSGRFRVQLAHIDHGLRPESAGDAARAREMAKALDLPISVTALKAGLAARAKGAGVEDAARRERYAALSGVCQELEAAVLALGHHQRDQAETVLLHLLRGAGLSGAAAMDELSRTSLAPGPRVWRPMLDESRDVLEVAARSTGMTPIDDPSNADPTFLRNWLRGEILPALERRLPGSTASLARFAAIAAEEDRLLERLADERRQWADREDGRLDWARIEGEPAALQRRIVKAWLAARLPEVEISFDRVQAVIRLAERGDPNAIVELGRGGLAVWSVGGVLAGPRIDVEAMLHAEFDGPLAPPRFVARELQSGVPAEIDGWRLTGWGSGAIVLRRVEHGDRMAGSGRPLREIARSGGVHPLLRRRLIAATQDNIPIWVAGLPSPESDWRFELTRAEGNW